VQQWTSNPQSFEQTGKDVQIAFQGKKSDNELGPKGYEFQCGWEKDDKQGEKITHKVYDHANMACASLFIGFTGLMVKLGQSGHDVGKVIQTK